MLATAGEVVWCSDSATFYYVEVDEKHRPVRVKRHRIGTSAAEDALVYEETEPGWFIDLDVTTSALFIVLTVSNHETSEVWLLDRKDPSASPRLVAARDAGVLYSVDHHGSDLVILTNADAAEDFKIVTAPLAASERRNWRELIPHRPGIMILFHMALARHLVRLERQDANPRIVVRDIWTGAEHAVDFDEEAYSLTVNPGYEFDTETIRFSYSSMATPSEVYDYDVRTRARVLRKRQEVPSGHEPSAYVTRRIFATAPDGEQVPISLLHRRGLVLDGKAPCLLYGYGSYGSSMPANFRTNPLSLVDRGFVYAIAHVRGGTEKGWGWYTQGKRENKPNTFKDFVACAEALTAAGYTARGRIVAHGGSAGGMLMGAVANMAPDLFAGIVADVPFVDVLNTMLDADLPLTPPEWPEWGNPGASEADFRTILSYSPYDNVEAAALSADPRARRPHRSPRHLLGAGEVGRAPARHHERGRPGAPEDQHGGRARRGGGAVRPPRGGRPDLRLRHPGNRGVRGHGGALGRMTAAGFAVAETRPKKNLEPVGTGSRGPALNGYHRPFSAPTGRHLLASAPQGRFFFCAGGTL